MTAGGRWREVATAGADATLVDQFVEVPSGDHDAASPPVDVNVGAELVVDAVQLGVSPAPYLVHGSIKLVRTKADESEAHQSHHGEDRQKTSASVHSSAASGVDFRQLVTRHARE
jgi:hypothetical protein